MAAVSDPPSSPEPADARNSHSQDVEQAKDENHAPTNLEILRQSWSRKDLIIAFSG